MTDDLKPALAAAQAELAAVLHEEARLDERVRDFNSSVKRQRASIERRKRQFRRHTEDLQNRMTPDHELHGQRVRREKKRWSGTHWVHTVLHGVVRTYRPGLGIPDRQLARFPGVLSIGDPVVRVFGPDGEPNFPRYDRLTEDWQLDETEDDGPGD